MAVLFFLLTIALGLPQSKAQELMPLQAGYDTSLRGLSVVNDSVAWVSGSKGWITRTTDAGHIWHWKQLEDYETLDFRDIEAFSSQKAVVVSAGSPAVVLLTTDAGRHWKEVYRNDSPDIFLDGMDFWDEQNGIIYGDPIDGRMQLLRTQDGGETWEDISDRLQEPLQPGEASFAASGTAIRTLEGGHVWIATGGSQSRVFSSSDYGQSWQVNPLPILQGKPSTGPFSLAFINHKKGVAAGGDYHTDTLRQNNLRITYNGGKSWQAPKQAPFGYRSAVEYLNKKTLIATGTTGTDLSPDGGKRWHRLSSEGFHTARKAKVGSWVLLTGNNGRIYTLKNSSLTHAMKQGQPSREKD
jgi:photosystem II stability/assembly factor-like uncharacterized protein